MRAEGEILQLIVTFAQIAYCVNENKDTNVRLKRSVALEDRSFSESGAYPSVVKEVCQWKTFNESCPTGSVMIVDKARFGRMRIGSCLDHNYGYQGCSADVQGYVEKRCSGKGSCQLSLPDEYLDHVPRPCPGDLKAYLELTYHCQRVEGSKEDKCKQGESIRIETSSGYLSNYITEHANLGSSHCPWILQAAPNQKFSIRLIDFGTWTSEEDSLSQLHPARSGLCHIYAQIQEKPTGRSSQSSNTIICAGERSDWMYTSETNIVHIEITNQKSNPDSTYFLLYYRVLGCREYEPRPGESILQYHNDCVQVTCSHGLAESSADGALIDEWSLKCVDGSWMLEGGGGIGAIPNCTVGGPAWGFVRFFSEKGLIGTNIVVILITLIAVLVALVILIIGVLSIRQRREQQRNGQRPRLAKMTQSKCLEQTYTAGRCKEQYPMLLKADTVDKCRESDYTITLPRHLPLDSNSQPRHFVSSNARAMLGSQSHQISSDVQSRADQCSGCWAAAAAAGISLVGNRAGDSNRHFQLFACEAHRREQQQLQHQLQQQQQMQQLQHQRQRSEHFVEHIYESPKFQRRGLSPDSDSQGTVYNELDTSVTDDRWT